MVKWCLILQRREFMLRKFSEAEEWNFPHIHKLQLHAQFTNGRDSGFGGLEDACWPLVLKFTGSNPAEAVGFFRVKKSTARLPSEGK
jgi:hypothetical protein